VCCTEDGLLYPDAVVGTDSHVAVNNGLGVVSIGELLPHAGPASATPSAVFAQSFIFRKVLYNLCSASTDTLCG